jgi:peptide/nickel transport system substrate-binding protein
MDRRSLIRGAGAAAVAGALPAAPALAQGAAARTLRVVPQANLTSLDPIWTTAVVTRNHGFMVYDQLCAQDAAGDIKPQMAEGWVTENDGRDTTFTLRPGLKFHDGEPVRAADCVASIKRWAARDVFAQVMWQRVDAVEALDDRRLRVRLKQRFPGLLLALGQTQFPCFIMPERIAATDPFQQTREAIGSGPFRFLRDEWNPGQRAVWARNDAYVPRQEPVDGLAGGRAPKIERIEWTIITDPATAANAMVTGEQDYWEYPLHDLCRCSGARATWWCSSGCWTAPTRSAASTTSTRLRQRRRPARGAMAVDQRDYMRAVAGNEKDGWETCEGVFTCGTRSPTRRERGAEGPQHRARQGGAARGGVRGPARGADRPRRLPADQRDLDGDGGPPATPRHEPGAGLDRLGHAGAAPGQQGAGGARRVEHDPHHLLRADPDPARVPPLPPHQRAERLVRLAAGRRDRAAARRLARRGGRGEAKRIAEALNRRAMEVLPYIPLGFYWQPSAWRRNVTGVFRAPVTAFWNMGKA